ncbi:MAG: hypothetical protein J4F39_09480 [Candidatus Latescibacteria bacterium]|nr:hypothetical protein [Candidatus Latescibacterota bacterium]
MTREEIFETVQSLAAEKDLYAASEFVLGLADELDVVKVFENLLLDCYWKAKSTERVIHFANTGIHYCLFKACACEGIDAAAAREFRFAAKRMATNAASFTWIGWDEPGVEISPEQMRHGTAFARYSVRQLHELDPTEAQLAFTYWYLGVHLMAQASYAEALSVFGSARDASASDGGNPDQQTMLEGYIGLTKILSGDNETGESEFDTAVAALDSRDNEDAAFYAKQLADVRTFFENRLEKS